MAWQQVFRALLPEPAGTATVAAPVLGPAQRRYTNLDGDKCFGFGYRLQDHALEPSERCLVDRSAVPLLAVLFDVAEPTTLLQPDTYCTTAGHYCVADLAAKFARLRAHCSTAFGADAGAALQRFELFFEYTTREYSRAQRGAVLDKVNRLLPWVFGTCCVGANSRSALVLSCARPRCVCALAPVPARAACVHSRSALVARPRR